LFAAVCTVAWVAALYWRRTSRFTPAGARLVLAPLSLSICVATSIWYTLQSRVPIVVALFGLLGAWVAFRVARRSPGGIRQLDGWSTAALTIAAWSASTAITATTWRQMWWVSPGAMRPFVPGLALIAILCALFVVLYTMPADKRRNGGFWRTCGTILMALAAFFAAFCTNSFGRPTLLHHWAVYVEPAIMIRQGHWLLWDVAAQYGYLTTCLIASMPFRSAWYGFYILNAALMAIAALLFYYVANAASRHAWHSLVAIVIAFSAFFIVPGMLSGSFPVNCYPSTSAFRFLWCYAAIALLVWEYLGRNDARATDIALIAGTLIWLISVFWSSESGVYQTVIWGPAYLLLIRRREERSGKRIGAAGWVKACLIPPALVAAGLILMDCVYRLRLGHAPDWSLATAYAYSFKHGFGWNPPDATGPLWLLLAGFVSPSMLAIWCVMRRGPAHRAAALLTACAGMVLATSTYYVGRSVDNNVNNLEPIVVMALCACWMILSKERVDGSLKGILVASMLPAIAMPIYLMTAQSILPGEIAHRFSLPSAPNDLQLGDMHATQAKALAQAGYRTGDAILAMGFEPIPVMRPALDSGVADAPRLLPLGPLECGIPLGSDTMLMLSSRFVQHAPRSGWIIVPVVDWGEQGEYRQAVINYILNNYVRDKVVTCNGEIVVHCIHR
ncbi:MAG: hypothetical protein P4L33_16210, partial [Capsulimonadaceae bacterium]|nr:hypothetical protein [Capsulimonadaceae bacterium]